MRHRLAVLAFVLSATASFLVFTAPVAHAGEDPVVGVLSKTGIGGMGCITVTASGSYSLQCLDSTSSTGARVRYRLMSASEFASGSPVPTDGGGMTDGGVYGSLVDFTVTSDPFRTVAKSSQTKLCLYAEDGGASGAFVTRCELSGSFP